jgi:hypothetical protein
VIAFSREEKEAVFDFMDRSRGKVVDYKTFLAVMNGGKQGDS